MPEATSIHVHEIFDLISFHPEGVRLSRLMEIVTERYGSLVTFHTGSAMSMDLDGLLRFLEAGGKLRITSGVIHPGIASARKH